MKSVVEPFRIAWRIEPFRRLLAGIGISSLGDGISAVAITWLALRLVPGTGAATAVAIAVAAYTIPGAVGSLVFAPMLRRLRGRQLAILDGLWRGVFLLCLPVAYELHVLTFPLLVILLVTSSLLAAWGKAGRYALIDEIVPERAAQAANSAANIVLEGAFVVGPLLAAALLRYVDAALVIGLDAVTFFILAGVYLFGIHEPADADEVGAPSGRKHGFSLIFRSPLVLALVGVSLFLFFFSGPIDVAIPLRVEEAGQQAGLFAGYLAAFGVGGFVGAALGGVIPRGALLPTTIAGVAGVGVFSVLAGAVPIGPLGWLFYTLAGVCWGPFPATTTTLFQRSVPKADLPPVLAARSAIQIFALPLGSLVAGGVITAVGPQTTIVVAGVLIAALALVLAPIAAKVGASSPANVE